MSLIIIGNSASQRNVEKWDKLSVEYIFWTLIGVRDPSIAVILSQNESFTIIEPAYLWKIQFEVKSINTNLN